MANPADPAAFVIRPAAAGDGARVVDLVRELAAFEKLPGPDPAAAARLGADVGRAGAPFEVLVAEIAGPRIVGYALYFTTYSTFLGRPGLYLEDLYVEPAARNRGVGAAFLRKLAGMAIDRGAARFEWTVLDWNEGAQRFYRSLGARVLPDWRVCRIDGEALRALATPPD